MEITAKEIKRQAGRVKEETDNFYSSCNFIIKMLDEMSRIVSSTDSNLSKRIAEYKESYIYIQTNLSKKFTNLYEIMNNYADKTLNNEQEMSDLASQASSDLQSISSSSEKMPEVYTDFN